MTAFLQRIDIKLLLVLSVLTGLTYGRLVGYDFQTSWDDNWVVLYEEAVRGFSFSNLKKAFTSVVLGSYVPLATVSYMLDYTLWGLDPRGFHLSNIIYHTLNGCLFYRLLQRWYPDRLVAFSAAALFLLHPVQVEVVAWVTQRRTLLCMLFVLLAWEMYCRYREELSARKRCRFYALSLVCYLFALLSKSEAVVLPVILCFYELCFHRTRLRTCLIDKVPYLIGAVLIAAVSMISQTAVDGARVPYHGGSLYATLLTMLPVFSRYIGMLFWPSHLSAFYAPQIRTAPDAQVWGSILLVVIFSGIILYSCTRERRIAFWFLLFLTCLLPVSQIVPINTLMQDRYLYFPLLGVSVLVAMLIASAGDRLGASRGRLLTYLLVALMVLACMVGSISRVAVWKNSQTLWSDAVVKEPRSQKAWELLGEALAMAGRSDEAIRAYERGYALNPKNTEILQGLGSLYTERGELERGLQLLERLLQIKPTYVTGWAALGTNRLQRGDLDGAEAAYRQALVLQPDAQQVRDLLDGLAEIRANSRAGQRY
jgi:hypothetical protein